MSKKILSVILAIVLCFSASVGVYAASVSTDDGDLVSSIKSDVRSLKKAIYQIKALSKSLSNDIEPYLMNVVLTSENIDMAIDIGAKAMIKIIEKIKDSSSPAEPTKPTEPTEPTDPTDPTDPTEPTEPQPSKIDLTIAELKKILQNYIFVKVDDVDASTLKVLKDVRYYPVELENGETTVYIAVDIKNNPDIFNYAVFRETVEKLYEEQGKELIKKSNGETDYLMSYEHIAGELALHAIVYAAVNELIDVTGTKNETILKLYEKAQQADLNIDEARVPWQVISIFGIILVDLLSFNVLKLFNLI
ncbi:MAG: hypothetical protein PUB94_03445 [Oscillospiraceae bacterium]|nr:hypothetical protein [Oscillospiraceae bacterium]